MSPAARDAIIDSQVNLPWKSAVDIATKSLKKRLMRSMITMVSVVLAIAFLMSILVGHNVVEGLRELNDPDINSLLMKNLGMEARSAGISSKMIWLVTLSLMVCSVGIVNAMLMSVTERFREIGTMKCLGALDIFIIKIFMIEAVIQGAAGTLAGIVIGFLVGMLGAVLTYGWAALSNAQYLAIVGSAVLSFVVGVGLCTVFAIYPAYVASTMQPVEAMRVEE